MDKLEVSVGSPMKIELTKAEALVLFDWLYENRQKEEYDAYLDEAITYVFSTIECQLERELVEPFYKNYQEILAKAKKSVKENYCPL